MLIAILYESIMRFYNPQWHKKADEIIIGAFTAKAAYNVGGTTLHSLLSMQVRQKGIMSKKTETRLENLYKNVKLLIIDEVSLIGLNFFENISNKLMTIFGSADLFGDLSILVVGDLNQLNPMLDHPIYHDNSTDGYRSLEGNLLWNRFSFYELKEIMRQKDDLEFSKFLHMIGNYGREFLTKEQVKLVDSRIFEFDDIPYSAIILTHTNEKVSEFNKARIGDDKNLVTVNNAIDELKCDKWTEYQQKSKLNQCKQLKLEDTDFMPALLRFKIGVKYMTTQNLDRTDGIVNGVVGELKKIITNKCDKWTIANLLVQNHW